MSAFDNAALEAAIKRYVRACGGNPDGASVEAVLAEREVEQAIEAHSGICDECGDHGLYVYCDGCGGNHDER